ncbi:MAG: hypothetical protein BGP24_21075 [Lysobacterales bacterium 69-70]|nr:hypothetical protein [Xanthomonadaceae bacterium]ODU33833.1 MAG: hypothetical protein ABS97_10995 [Xanthomonadaceae bacterium SCN 69-320]ODV20993.1 MAG: hypothetical protein ABT27_05475 [Xanthomonadaceae bacterium SCN 69-25]OJZ01326.1 MAG: hypothetical protein BGP24_21075 [Xanthomonadales bacterium 69-70]
MSYTIVLNQSGALPQVYPFSVPIDGDVTIAFSGTCWSTAANSLGGVVVFLDDAQIGEAPLFFNAASQHMALPTQFFAVTLTPGPHTITLKPLTANTISDKNDFFSLWVVD